MHQRVLLSRWRHPVDRPSLRPRKWDLRADWWAASEQRRAHSMSQSGSRAQTTTGNRRWAPTGHRPQASLRPPDCQSPVAVVSAVLPQQPERVQPKHDRRSSAVSQTRPHMIIVSEPSAEATQLARTGRCTPARRRSSTACTDALRYVGGPPIRVHAEEVTEISVPQDVAGIVLRGSPASRHLTGVGGQVSTWPEMHDGSGRGQPLPAG